MICDIRPTGFLYELGKLNEMPAVRDTNSACFYECVALHTREFS